MKITSPKARVMILLKERGIDYITVACVRKKDKAFARLRISPHTLIEDVGTYKNSRALDQPLGEVNTWDPTDPVAWLNSRLGDDYFLFTLEVGFLGFNRPSSKKVSRYASDLENHGLPESFHDAHCMQAVDSRHQTWRVFDRFGDLISLVPDESAERLCRQGVIMVFDGNFLKK